MAPEIKYRYLCNDPEYKYELIEDYTDIVPFFGWLIENKKGDKSDGATGARDLGAIEKGWRRVWSLIIGRIMHSPKGKKTSAWFSHDRICVDGYVIDKVGNRKKIPNVIASLILSLILWRDGYKKETFTWFFPTLFGGGGKCKENGMFWLKKEIF